MRFVKEFIVLILVAISIRTFSAETRKVVAVVDTGLPYNHELTPYLCKGLQFDVTQSGIEDHHGHGTNVLGLIAKTMNNKTHCLTMIKWWDSTRERPSLDTSRKRVEAYSNILFDIKPAYVNLSLSGFDYNPTEYHTFKDLLKGGTVIVTAAGNDSQNLNALCDVYPACYNIRNKNFHVVGALGANYSNYGGPVTDLLPGFNQCGMFGICFSGTSQAAANETAQLLKEIR